jgi:peptidyl-prolyl cis-trans isomerase SurA
MELAVSQCRPGVYPVLPGALADLPGEIRLQVEARLFQRRNSVALALSTSLLLVALAACNRTPSPDVMATVNGKEILRAELDKAYKANIGDNPQEQSAQQANIVRLNLLRQMIDDEILQQRAAKLNLAASDEDVNAKLTEFKAPFTQEEFDKQLKQRNMSLDDLKLQIRRTLTSTKLINKEIESKINITDSDISGFYAAHKADFNVIEPQYHMAWIVVTGMPAQQAGNLQNNKATSEADARKKIETIHNRIETGEDFGGLAMNFSEDPNTASSGGDMGFVAESALQQRDPAAFAAIDKLKLGQITEVLPIYGGSGPARRPVGYAIYKLIAREPAGQRELNNPSVQQNIRQSLRDSHAQLLKNAYFETLRDEAKVRNYFAEQILKEGAK